MGKISGLQGMLHSKSSGLEIPKELDYPTPLPALQ
jgi:hypothetical protein